MKRTTIAGICLLAIAFAAGFSLSTFQNPAQAGEYGAFVSPEMAMSGCEDDVCIGATNCEDGGDGMQCNMVGSKCNTTWCDAPE